VLFTSLVGIVFVMVYAFSVHWLIAPVYFLTVPISAAQLGAQPAHQADPEGDRRRDDGARRIDDRVAAQHRAGEEAWASGSRRSRASTGRPRNPEARAEEGEVPAQPQLHPGHVGEPAAHRASCS
jgi:hypothetical protein